MKLHYRTLGEGPPVIILHGIFGTSDNWQTFGKQLATDYQVFLIDQRNHGLSPHSNTFDYPAMAEDLHEFIQQHQLESPIILGHSMGGKAAMFYATTHPNEFDKLIVVDIAPRSYPVHHQHILSAMSGVDLASASSRRDIEDQLKPHLPDFGVRQFIMKNLKREDNNSFSWKLNLSAIQDNIENVGVAVDTAAPVEKTVLFVRGEKSDYIRPEDEALIQQIFPQASVITIENAGHWVHAEQPEALYKALMKFLG
ncbi:alpha/beta fold hydrolase [Tunicatimonas pelagia]|uniref:alpha/beta fold hydrolase n=1 Tax=Tunicatimonas pelagia TaxID=931531 RepID=UPI0026661E86|nr:alpha/beta fold hydrolase [Tunicatimonas pelagia]WKN44548.1 alpha/beta fold hydrolase [Tunicatimonas pelagia]